MAEAKPKPWTSPKRKLTSQRWDGASRKQEILEGDPDDGRGDHRLHDPVGEVTIPSTARARVMLWAR